MKSDAEGSPQAHYVRLCRALANGTVSEVVLTRAAMHLHTFGVLTSVESATPGFVSDRYLDSVRTDTTLTALELTLTGLWERADDGYRVSAEEVAAVGEQLHLQLAAMAERCESGGGHRVGVGGSTCSRCGHDAAPEHTVRARHRPAA